MRADIVRIWTTFRLVIIIAMVAAGMSFLAVSFLSDGLTATRGAQQLRDYGVVANVTDVRIHVSRSKRTSSGTASASRRYTVDQVEVVFTDPQGQKRSERLGSYLVHGSIPNVTGWTTQFEGHDTFVGKEALYLPDAPGRAQMRDHMQSTLDHGFEPAPTYIGLGAMVLALLGWAGFAMVVLGMLRSRGRRTPGIA